MKHCNRPWWKRPPVWFIAIAAVLLLSWLVMEQTEKQPPTPYGVFLDQVEAGNVASITFQGTEIHGRFKRPLDSTQRDTFSTRVPDVGDPTLIPALRKQHVAIDVRAPSPWTSVLARIPWPMLVFLGVLLIAALVRLVRGGKASPGSATAALPAHGMMGLLSGLFAKQRPDENPPKHDGDAPKNR